MRAAVTSVALSLVTLALTAPTALATEEGEEILESEAFGMGEWDGMTLALIVGIVIGLIVFSTIGGKAEPTHHGEEAVHGDDMLTAE